MKRNLLAVISILFSLIAVAQNCNSLRYQDTILHQVTVTTAQFGTAVPYGLLAQPQDLSLDFYEPTGDTLSKRPLIIFQFGGGFTIGWRSEPDIPQFCDYFAKCGYAVASIDYRIGLNATDTNSTIRAYYRGVQDERSAIRFLAQRAQQYRIDTSLIILTGTSAGCFCALANAFTNDANRPVSSYGSVLEPNDLGCMDCSGNTDLGHHIPHIKAIINQWGAILDTSYIEASENTPVISFHGDQDNLVPYISGYPFSLPVFPTVYGSVPIHQRLTNVGIRNELHPLVGFGHEPELLNPGLNDTIYNYSRVFLFDLLRPHTSEITGDTMFCTHTLATYSVINTPGSKYCWTLTGNGTIVSDNENAITVLWNDTGRVSVSVKELNYIMAEGEVKTTNTYVSPSVTASFGYNIDELHIAFLDMSANASNFYWNFGDGTTSTTESPVKDYAGGGNYTITLVADNGFCSDTFSSSITIDSCPKANITYQANNHNVFLYTDSTNTVSYSWNFGDGDSASVNFPNVFHQYQQAGEYMVYLKVKNRLGCEAVDTMTITMGVTGLPELDNNTISCNAEGCDIQISGDAAWLEMFDAAGSKVLKETIKANYHLRKSEYPPGVYLLRVSNKEGSALRKLVNHQR